MEVTESTVTGAVSNRLSKTRLTMKHRLHGAILGKDAVPRGTVPIHLAVKVVAIQTLRSRFEIVSRVARPGRWRNQSQYFRSDRANWNGGLVRKRRPSGSVRVSGRRVIDSRPGASEVSGSKGRSRHGLETSRSLAVITFKGPVIASEGEQIVPLNGASTRAAEVIQDALTLSLASCRGLKELSCSERLVLMLFKQGTGVLIGS